MSITYPDIGFWEQRSTKLQFCGIDFAQIPAYRLTLNLSHNIYWIGGRTE
jgi:hypothetical protein